jgi:hypothetical protein
MKEKNVGTVDRYIRFGIGAILIIVAFILQGAWLWLLLPAVVSIVTGAISHCGLYSLFGISTCKTDKSK